MPELKKKQATKRIPIIDLFAGPGGLGEGFSSILDEDNERVFEIKLSIEKDEHAHKTLKLRSFFRQFPVGRVPEDYYRFVRGEITLQKLYELHPNEEAMANNEAWCGTLGDPDEEDTNGVSDKEVDKRIRKALGRKTDWLLIGGPPCQAYSLVGRSRRQQTTLSEENDKRVGLYKEYLRILAVHTPAVFVMENVKGILSAETEDDQVFTKILADLSDPVTACKTEKKLIRENKPPTKYRIYSLTTNVSQTNELGDPVFKPSDFIIKAENFGVPQKRHRVILLGIRENVKSPNSILKKQDEVSLHSIISNLPFIRSGVTRTFSHTSDVIDKEGNPKKRRHYIKIKDSSQKWAELVNKYSRSLDHLIEPLEGNLGRDLPTILGSEFMEGNYCLPDHHKLASWYKDERLSGVLHHVSRKHLAEDLNRYLFASRFTQKNKRFPRLGDYIQAGNGLAPDHENVRSGKFADRFRVQLPDIAATTVTSHISKDGHYFIHYDPVQCRSFTVREAARVQTFPDNYYFCGGRTDQFHQVGNAVPPYLAKQIGEIVEKIFNK